MKYVICLFIIFFLPACQTSNYQKAESFYVSKNTELKLIPLKSFDKDITLNQIMESEYGGKKRIANSVVKLSNKELKVLAFADTVRLFSITYDGENIASEFSPLIPASKIKPEYILFDIQLIYFPVEAISKTFPKNVKIKAGETYREIYVDDVKIVEILYQGKEIHFHNLEHNYSYKIERVDEE